MVKTAEPAVPAASEGFVKREFNGASFLGLEHIGHMALVVIVPGIILSGLTTAFTMWFGLGSFSPVPDIAYFGGTWISALMAIGLVAALLILAPLQALLGRRSRREWHKRPAFVGRLAYKVPVYGALAAATAAVIWFKIQLLSVILATLAFIGVPDAPFASMYGSTFLPAFIGLLLYASVWWYIFRLVKGQDYGRLFDVGVGVVSTLVVIALFITAAVKLHDPGFNSSVTEPLPSRMYDLPSYLNSEKSYR